MGSLGENRRAQSRMSLIRLQGPGAAGAERNLRSKQPREGFLTRVNRD